MSKTKEEILDGYKPMLREWHHLIKDRNATEEDFVNELIHRLDLIIAQTREETIGEEIAYWTDVFDNRPKYRDLESDNIAQNFARIEIERLENKLK